MTRRARAVAWCGAQRGAPWVNDLKAYAWLLAIIPIYLLARESVFVVIVMSAYANYASERAVAEAKRGQS